MHVALEHHMTNDDDAYPDMGERWRPSILSRIVSVADCYVSLQTHRSARGSSITPYMALGMMLGPLKSRFDPALLWSLVQTVGIYPPGTVVTWPASIAWRTARTVTSAARATSCTVKISVSADGAVDMTVQRLDGKSLAGGS